MILRRLAQSLKEQNWTAISVEFVLLVLGVFLGIQAANWNEERQMDTRRSAALARLHAESEAAIAYLEQRIQLMSEDAESRTDTLRRLSDNDWEGADLGQAAKALESLQYAPAISPPRAVYDELIGAGLYSELGDARLRDAVSSYIASIGFVQRQIDYVRARFVERNDGRSFKGERPVFDPTSRRQVRRAYDFPALSNDPEYVANAVLNNESTIAQVGWTRDLLEKARAMCAEISRLDGQPCNPARDAGP